MIANVAARHAQAFLKFQFGNYLYLIALPIFYAMKADKTQSLA